MTGVLAQYASLDEARQAIESLREAGHLDLQVYSPVPSEELEEAMDIHSSPVGLWALIGGITGCITGLLITAGTSLAYPIVTQGKPIVSIPPFIVVMFELTILLTGIFALMAMLIHARKPAFRLAESYRTSFSVDRWGVFVPSRGSEQSRVETIVREAGAVDVEVEVHR